MKQVTTFITSDGSEFETEAEALAWEEAQELVADAEKFGTALAAAGHPERAITAKLNTVKEFLLWQAGAAIKPPVQRKGKAVDPVAQAAA